MLRFKHKIFEALGGSSALPAVHELDEGDQFYQFIFQENPFPGLVFDMTSLKFIEINNAAIEFYGYSEDEFLSMDLTAINDPAEIPLLEECLKTIRDNKPWPHRAWKHIKKGGDKADVEVRGIHFHYKGKETCLFVINDITDTITAEFNLKKLTEKYTERKKLEQELLDQQKAISQATINTQEKERMEISKELHDNVNQVLTTTKLYLDLALTNPDLKDDMISKSSKNIINAITEIRKLSQSLMIPSLGDLGLIDSIGDLVENMNATKKIDASFIHDAIDENSLSENQKLTLFRIAQEALNNIVKHANATHTTIELFEAEKKIELTIKDDGEGFDPVTAKKGAGLNNIRNRVYLLNGNLTVNTQPGKGCTLIVELPHHH